MTIDIQSEIDQKKERLEELKDHTLYPRALSIIVQLEKEIKELILKQLEQNE